MLPTVVIPEGEIDRDNGDAFVIGVAGEVDDVSESAEAVDSEDDADVTSVAARARNINLSEQVVAAG